MSRGLDTITEERGASNRILLMNYKPTVYKLGHRLHSCPVYKNNHIWMPLWPKDLITREVFAACSSNVGRTCVIPCVELKGKISALLSCSLPLVASLYQDSHSCFCFKQETSLQGKFLLGDHKRLSFPFLFLRGRIRSPVILFAFYFFLLWLICSPRCPCYKRNKRL